MIIENNDKISLNTLLKNYIVYIPDMQRDFCWGTTRIDNTDITLFENFINTLEQNISQNNKDFTMGLFYGYTENKRLYLCDGQQRITSLYLILLYGYKLGLVNEDILTRNNITTLQYAVRDSSLFFLNDLFVHIKHIEKIESIKYTDWYINEYNNDDTIINIMASLKILETYYENNKEALNRLVSYILNEINFIFIDMNTRENGEETYVLLNTTGEPLTRIENLKPYLVYDDDTTTMENNTVEWEKIEQFFWEQSIRISENQSNLDRNTIAETLMNNFLDIITTAEYQNIEIDSIKVKDKNKNTIVSANKLTSLSLGKYSEYYKDKTNLEIIIEYFKNFKTFYNILDTEQQDYLTYKMYKIDKYNYIREYYTIIALIYFAKKFLNTNIITDSIKQNAHRFFHLFYNIMERITEDGGINNYYIQDVINTVKKMDNSDVLSLLKIENSFIIKDKEETWKLKIIRENLPNRQDIEETFRKAEEESFLKHRILFILDIVNYARNIDNNNDYLHDFKIYYVGILKYFKEFNNITRALFINKNAPDYPLSENSDRNHFIIQEEVYKWLYNNNKTYDAKVEFIYNLISEKIDSNNNSSSMWVELLKYNKSMLNYAKQKRFFIYKDTIFAIRNINATSVISQYTTSMFYTFVSDNNELTDKVQYTNNFNIWIYDKYEGGIIAIENPNIVIDINATYKDQYKIEIFNRKKASAAQILFEDSYFNKFKLSIENNKLCFTLTKNENGEQYTHQMVKNLIDDIIIHLENFKC